MIAQNTVAWLIGAYAYIIFQHLAIYNNENLLTQANAKTAKVGRFKHCQRLKICQRGNILTNPVALIWG